MRLCNKILLKGSLLLVLHNIHRVDAFSVVDVLQHAHTKHCKTLTSLDAGHRNSFDNETRLIARPHIDIGIPKKDRTQSSIVPVQKEVEIQPKSSEQTWAYAMGEAIVHGNSLKTYSFSRGVDRAELLMKTQGRPLDADVEIWQGPDNTPLKIRVHLEDGGKRTFRSSFELPGMYSHSIAIRNIGQEHSPLTSGLFSDPQQRRNNSKGPAQALSNISEPSLIQGGSLNTYRFKTNVESVQVMIKTNGLALNARVELFQGPENDKHVMEIYSENGNERPFYAVVETPGAGNVVSITNTASIEFPIYASVEAYLERKK